MDLGVRAFSGCSKQHKLLVRNYELLLLERFIMQKEDIVVTEHARKKMTSEGISHEQIREALQRGSKFQQTDGLLCTYIFFSVAYKKIGEKYIIKTVFLNG